MKCKTCGKPMVPAEAGCYGGRCEECWLSSQGTDMRGKFVEGGRGKHGDSAGVHSPKVWPEVMRGRRSPVRDN